MGGSQTAKPEKVILPRMYRAIHVYVYGSVLAIAMISLNEDNTYMYMYYTVDQEIFAIKNFLPVA